MPFNKKSDAQIKSLISQADVVLTSSVRNEYGEWIENEIGLFKWLEECKTTFNKVLGENHRQNLTLNKIINKGVTTPSDVKKIKKLLVAIYSEIS
jgi:hypothetical protein